MRFDIHSVARLALLPLALFMLLTAAACVSIAAPAGWADPVFDSGVVYYSPLAGKLEAYDLSAHKVVWDFPNSQTKNVKAQGIYSTPVLDPQTVYFGAYDGSVYALDRTSGQLRWQQSFDGGSPIIGGLLLQSGVIYFANSEGHVFAIQTTDGKIVPQRSADGHPAWPESAGQRVWSTPVYDGSDIIITSMDRSVYAFNTDGHLDWKTAGGAAAIASTPRVDSGRLTFGGFDKRYHELDASNGESIWTSDPATNWFWTQGLIEGGTLYAGNLDGSVYAYDASNGDVKWHADLGAPIRSAPALVDGALLVAARNGTIYGLDPSTGSQKWTPISAGASVLANLVTASGNTVYAVTQPGSKNPAHLFQIDPVSGTKTDVIVR